jgi:thiosulfate dehydrogenase
MMRKTIPAVAILLAVAACDTVDTRSVARSAPPADSSATSSARSSAYPLIPAAAGIERVKDLVHDPARDSIARDPRVAAMVRRGYDIFRSTRAAVPALAGNDLSCGSCHLNGGQKEGAWPLVGVATLFPQYRSRPDRLITLEDRIADCFERSMNGVAPARDSEEMLALSAYLTWLARGLPAGEEPAWRNINDIPQAALLPIDQLRPDSGRVLFEKQCVACHGADGQGVNLGVAQPGPLWGPRSWNDGAGAARIYTLAGFIRHAMPLTAPGSISDTDAQHIAAWINSHDRPAFRNKRGDFPRGNVPVDAVYYPQRYSTNPLRR